MNEYLPSILLMINTSLSMIQDTPYFFSPKRPFFFLLVISELISLLNVWYIFPLNWNVLFTYLTLSACFFFILQTYLDLESLLILHINVHSLGVQPLILHTSTMSFFFYLLLLVVRRMMQGSLKLPWWCQHYQCRTYLWNSALVAIILASTNK